MSACGSCGFANDVSDRFCGGCSSALEAAPIAVKPAARSKFAAAPRPTVRIKAPRPAARPHKPTPPSDDLTSRLVALNRARVGPASAIDLTEEVKEVSDELAQDQIDALFQQ